MCDSYDLNVFSLHVWAKKLIEVNFCNFLSEYVAILKHFWIPRSVSKNL